MKRYLTIISGILLLCTANAFALGGGGFRNEAALDAEANGMAGCFVAQADSPAAVHYNPAGMVQMEGNYVRVGNTTQAPRNSHTSTAGNESYMQMQTFHIPSIYVVNDIGFEDWKFGLSVTSPYGLGTDWADDSFSRYQATETSLEFYQINPAIAYKVNDVLSVGVGADYMKSYISKHKRINDTGGVGDFHLKGDDDAWGYNVGLLYRPSEQHSFGVSYRSEIEMTYKGHASLSNLSQGIYSAVFPDVYVTGLESDLTVPQSVALGYAYRPDDKWTIEVDIDWTDWTSIQEDYVKWTDETNATRLSILNGGNPAPKDWHASLAYGIGAQYKANEKWTLRGGYLFIETPIPSANFETALPDTDRHGITLGAGYKLREDFTIDVAYFGVLMVERDVTNDVASASSNLDGEYKGYVNVFSVGLTYKY
ncbi:MAG: OmpP1/FadL family transporter [Candidatus Omnitrophica bacterium]|nr:OmpP1/FadL family transporter [Candidatus Omnitrophota bacterium]